MFERYTEKARRTIFFARYEASAFGSLQIETEHLLLGLARRRAPDQAPHWSLSVHPIVPRTNPGLQPRWRNHFHRHKHAANRRMQTRT